MIYLYQFSHYAPRQTGGEFFYTEPAAGPLLGAWRQTSYETSVSPNVGSTYTPQEGLTHSAIKYDSEQGAGSLTVTVPKGHPVAQLFRNGAPVGLIALRITEMVAPGEASGGLLTRAIWNGRLHACKFHSLTAELLGVDIKHELRHPGLRINAGPTCQWQHYGPSCKLAEAAYTRAGTVTAITEDGLNLTTTLDEADDFFKDGKVYANGGVRMCTGSVGGVLTVLSAFHGLLPGAEISASKGCNRSGAACKQFDNYIRFSAFDKFETPKNIFAEGTV